MVAPVLNLYPYLLLVITNWEGLNEDLDPCRTIEPVEKGNNASSWYVHLMATSASYFPSSWFLEPFLLFPMPFWIHSGSYNHESWWLWCWIGLLDGVVPLWGLFIISSFSMLSNFGDSLPQTTGSSALLGAHELLLAPLTSSY